MIFLRRNQMLFIHLLTSIKVERLHKSNLLKASQKLWSLHKKKIQLKQIRINENQKK